MRVPLVTTWDLPKYIVRRMIDLEGFEDGVRRRRALKQHEQYPWCSFRVLYLTFSREETTSGRASAAVCFSVL